jgi:hypothetical protein
MLFLLMPFKAFWPQHSESSAADKLEDAQARSASPPKRPSYFFLQCSDSSYILLKSTRCIILSDPESLRI